MVFDLAQNTWKTGKIDKNAQQEPKTLSIDVANRKTELSAENGSRSG
jgi:hypothetical protein